MKRLLQILTTAVAGALLMGGVVGATSNNCSIYKAGSTSYNSCLNNLTKTSVQVVCENNVYVINDNSQNAGTGGSVTFNGNSASGNATNTSGSTVKIGASCGQATSSSTSTSPSGGSTCGSSKTCPTSSKTTNAASNTAAAAGSLPETGSNTVVNAAIVGTALLVSGLAISYVGTALYRRAALKD